MNAPGLCTSNERDREFRTRCTMHETLSTNMWHMFFGNHSVLPSVQFNLNRIWSEFGWNSVWIEMNPKKPGSYPFFRNVVLLNPNSTFSNCCANKGSFQFLMTTFDKMAKIKHISQGIVRRIKCQIRTKFCVNADFSERFMWCAWNIKRMHIPICMCYS